MGEENTNDTQQNSKDTIRKVATTEYIDESANVTPNTETITDNSSNKQKESINLVVNLPKEDKGHKRNEIAATWAGVLVQIILALFTYLLFVKTGQANKTASEALAQSTRANNISAQALNNSRINDSISRRNDVRRDSLDSIRNGDSRIRERLNYELSYKSLKTQINSINRAQKDFENENRPLIQVTDMRIDSVESGKIPSITFRLSNTGKFPGKLLHVVDTLIFDSEYTQKKIESIQLGKGRTPNSFVPMGGNIGVVQTLNRVITKEGSDAYKSHIGVFYFIIKYKYISLVTNIQYGSSEIYRISYNIPSPDIIGLK